MNNQHFLREICGTVARLLVPLPRSLAEVELRIRDVWDVGMSWISILSRRMGAAAILLVGVAASFYALVLLIGGWITPDAPQSTQDTILRTRWSSPRPAKDVVIVDIDERSLAALAPDFGRWPWPRSVLADGLDKISDAGARAVLFNVMLSDPDKASPDSDGAMEVTAAMIPGVAYPIIRLNPENDSGSQLRVKKLLELTGDPAEGKDGTVAAILPMFESMLPRIGVANQLPDDDGVVRRYAVSWRDDSLVMPSIAARAVRLAGYETSRLPDVIVLNWRNKNGRYQRISFSDLLNSKQSNSLDSLKGAVVVLGVSAPGLGQTKGTSVAAVEDDNEILATAVDDMIHGTYLRVLPPWLVFIVQLATIWVLVWVGLGREFSSWLTLAFMLVQSGAAGITLLSASYTSYLIDLTGCMAFGALIYGVIKAVHALDASWSRARPGFRRLAKSHDHGTVVLVGYRDGQVYARSAAQLQRTLEDQVGIDKVVRIDDLLGGESFVRPACEEFSCQMCLVTPDAVPALLVKLRGLAMFDLLDIRDFPLPGVWNPEDDGFRLDVVPHVLRQCADLMAEGGSTKLRAVSVE